MWASSDAALRRTVLDRARLAGFHGVAVGRARERSRRATPATAPTARRLEQLLERLAGELQRSAVGVHAAILLVERDEGLVDLFEHGAQTGLVLPRPSPARPAETAFAGRHGGAGVTSASCAPGSSVAGTELELSMRLAMIKRPRPWSAMRSGRAGLEAGGGKVEPRSRTSATRRPSANSRAIVMSSREPLWRMAFVHASSTQSTTSSTTSRSVAVQSAGVAQALAGASR